MIYFLNNVKFAYLSYMLLMATIIEGI